MSDEFREKLTAFAQRAVDIAPNCKNEEGTKQFLILPFLSVLGYDDRNPNEVCPEHGADFSDKYKNRVDYAILKNGTPIIAIECKCCGAPLKEERGQLRAYFNAAPTVKMGVLTDGIVWEFYADSDAPNLMDSAAFLTVDLREIARGKIEKSLLDSLSALQKVSFDPENIGAEAKRKLVFQSILKNITALAESPSAEFTRMMIQAAGLTHIRSRALAEYQDLVREAFSEFINVRILKRLDLPARDVVKAPTPLPVAQVPQVGASSQEKIRTTQTELELFEYVKRRLSFLVKEEDLFSEINSIKYRDYQGKFVVFYKKERKGRLFDFVEGEKPRYRFQFGDAGEVESDDLAGIDELLLSTFLKRIQEERRA